MYVRSASDGVGQRTKSEERETRSVPWFPTSGGENPPYPFVKKMSKGEIQYLFEEMMIRGNDGFRGFSLFFGGAL